jgi:group II intron reverse transcriptase/maturase
METKLKRIATLSSEGEHVTFKWLIQQVTEENLISCFHELDGKKAMGIDGISKDEYGVNLEENIRALVAKMKSMDYQPAPVRETKIPKGDGKFRALGISNIEDKIVQMMFAKILTAIYEPMFVPESFGFRPGKSCHDAIKNLHEYLSKKNYGVVIDVDLSNFFGSINHRKLIQILEIKIKDKVFIRYIVRMLKAGVLSDGELVMSDDGTPQGSIVSPILANVFAHYAIDRFIRDNASELSSDHIHMVRYADDLVLCVRHKDAEKVLTKLKERLERFSLELNEGKTSVVNFSKVFAAKGIEQGKFKYLGFTFYLGKARNGAIVVKLKTNKETFKRKLKAMTEWCKENRNKFRLAKLWKTFSSKIRGHIQYYGVSHNFESMKMYVFEAKRIFFKWINRRSQKKSFNWKKFDQYVEAFPLPKIKIAHRLF